MGAQEEHVEPLVQIVTASAPVGVGGAMPGECQVPAFLYQMCKRGAQGVGPLQRSKCGVRTSPGFCTA